MNAFSIAIDGPSGAGKSTAAKAVARELGFMYLDTGAMYRTIGLYMLRQGVALDDAETILRRLPEADIEVRFVDGEQKMFLNGEDVSAAIRTPEGSAAASRVSVIPEVRTKMVEMQQRIAADNDVVMDGRDICLYVLPNAQLKLFLTASAEERARRRWLERKEQGSAQTYEEVLKDVIERDERDSQRAASPLEKAPDAVEIDSSDMSLEEVVAEIIRLAKERMERQ